MESSEVEFITSAIATFLVFTVIGAVVIGGGAIVEHIAKIKYKK